MDATETSPLNLTRWREGESGPDREKHPLYRRTPLRKPGPHSLGQAPPAPAFPLRPSPRGSTAAWNRFPLGILTTLPSCLPASEMLSGRLALPWFLAPWCDLPFSPRKPFQSPFSSPWCPNCTVRLGTSFTGRGTRQLSATPASVLGDLLDVSF